MNQSLYLLTQGVEQGNSAADEMWAYINSFLNVWLLMALSCVGMMTNSLTIAVFRRQGWKDGVNISMTVISVLDLVRCLLTILKRIHGFIELVSPSDGVSWSNATTPNVEFLNIMIAYVSYTLLAYVSLERSLCVTMPFTVRIFFTPKVTSTILAAISASVCGLYFVMFLNFGLEAVFSANLNSTVTILVHSRFYNSHYVVVDPYLNILSMLHPTLCFVILCISSVVIMKQLRKSRDSFSSNKNDELISNRLWCKTQNSSEKICSATLKFSKREKQVTKMLLVVMGVYIGNLVPRVLWYAWQMFEAELRPLGRLGELFMFSVTAMFTLDILHASVHFFIFYYMSLAFRSTFHAIWISGAFLDVDKVKQ